MPVVPDRQDAFIELMGLHRKVGGSREPLRRRDSKLHMSAFLKPLADVLQQRGGRMKSSGYRLVDNFDTYYLAPAEDGWRVRRVISVVDIEVLADELPEIRRTYLYPSDPTAVLKPKIIHNGDIVREHLHPGEAKLSVYIRPPTLRATDRYMYVIQLDVETTKPAQPARIWFTKPVETSIYRLVFEEKQPRAVWSFDHLHSEMQMPNEPQGGDYVRARDDNSYYHKFENVRLETGSIHGLGWMS